MFSAPELELGEGFDEFLERNLNKELLRFTTAGSVDDGKSTLIGRLLHDAKAVYEDQLASVKKSHINRSGRAIDFALLTDGLRAEREQGITIDVAYRYFSTPRRKFIVADTPGHEQYTRNMATGASTANLAVILVDATRGLLPQTNRHLYIASLLGIPRVLAAINKMDLRDYREDIFRELETGFLALTARLGVPSAQCIPISALEGDNVVDASERMPWYSGPSLLRHLETVEIDGATEADAVRFPVQYVIRSGEGFRGFAGRVASGTIRPGDAVLALPSGQQTVVDSIVTYDGELDEAVPSQSVVLKLANEIDLSRGDMLVSAEAPPHLSKHFAAMVVWLHAQALERNRQYLVKHAGRHVKAKATQICFAVDMNTLHEQPVARLELNGIAAVEFETSSPLFFDPYDRNRTTGSFIVIDPLSNATVGAGMIREDLSPRATNGEAGRSRRARPRAGSVTAEERYERHGHRPAVFSVSGDAGFAESLERALFERGFETLLVKENDPRSPAPAAFLSRLLSAGFVVVSWSETGASREPDASVAAPDGFVFDVPPGVPNIFDKSLARALAVAETLRVGNDDEGKQTED
jgi:sulfate adenylyltransferase large subunit